jgi:hypothetical protein
VALRLYIEFERDDYSGYSTTPAPVGDLTPRQASVLASAAVLLLYRQAWQPMTDGEWDALSDDISTAIETLNNV